LIWISITPKEAFKRFYKNIDIQCILIPPSTYKIRKNYIHPMKLKNIFQGFCPSYIVYESRYHVLKAKKEKNIFYLKEEETYCKDIDHG
jgi:hypothetical protein